MSDSDKLQKTYPFYKDYTTKLLSITSAATVAVAAYAETGHQKGYKWLLIISMVSLGLSLVIQLRTALLAHVCAKADYDGDLETFKKWWPRLFILMKLELWVGTIGVAAAYSYVLFNLITS